MKIHNSAGKREKCEMYSCVRTALRLCRWFGFFPVEGLNKPSIVELKYNLKSPYTVYYMFSILGQVLMTGICLHGFIKYHYLMNFGQFVFYLSSLMSALLLFKFARNWSSLVKKAAEIEFCLTEIRTTNVNKISLKSNILTSVVVTLGLVDYILVQMLVLKVITACIPESKLTTSVFEKYFISRVPFLFEYVSFNIWIAMFLQMTNMQASFMWFFADIMIIGFSVYLESYFKDLNKIIYSNKDKETTQWGQFRAYYSEMVILVKTINDQLDFFVMFAFFFNIFFMCLQLFKTMSTKNEDNLLCDLQFYNIINFIYYFYSFMFLVTRTVIFSLLSANVHAAAHAPVAALENIPASIYNIEVQRFYRQLQYTVVALGGKFFYVTRQTLLKVVGTLITYELVLLQFNHAEKTTPVILSNTTSYHRFTFNKTLT